MEHPDERWETATTDREKYLALRKAVRAALRHIQASEYKSTDIERAERELRAAMRRDT